MKDTGNFKIFDDPEVGIVLKCYDSEIADQFDDFLIDNLDLEVHFKFSDRSVSFFFGKEFSVLDVSAIYTKFEEKFLIK